MYRDMLRSAGGFKVRRVPDVLLICYTASNAQDYNFRRYALRRVQEEFRAHAAASADAVPALLVAVCC